METIRQSAQTIEVEETEGGQWPHLDPFGPFTVADDSVSTNCFFLRTTKGVVSARYLIFCRPKV